MTTKKTPAFTTKRMALNAVMVALYIALSTLAIPPGGLKLTVEHLPVIITAVLFGPLDALLVGGLGELINQMLTFGFTPTTILWMTPAMFRGLSMGLCAKFLAKYAGLNAVIEKKLPIAFLVICVISGLICSLLNTFTLYVDSKMFGYYSYAMVFGVLWVRLATSAVSSVLMAVVAKPVTVALRKAKII
jgi:ECF transporter S component (folate family)